MNENKFASKEGFLLSAIGGAVGLGNIWMFPSKLKNYGGTFLYSYFFLAFTVGVTLLTLEFILGKYFKGNLISIYRINSPKFKFTGFLTVISPLIILMYYSAAGGMCLTYLIKNVFDFLSIKVPFLDDFTFVLTFIFVILIYKIVLRGVNEGIERFNKITVPILMIVVIIWAVVLLVKDNTHQILKEMFLIKSDFCFKENLKIVAISADQMFFSLSIAVGSMITYGSMMPDNQNTFKSACLVCVADTLFAITVSVVVIKASLTYSINSSGPNLVFITMQKVFDANGKVGNLLGILFYLAIIFAALTSAVSYIEVPVSALNKLSTIKRKKSLLICLSVILLPAIYITIEDFASLYKIISLIGEGLIIPLTAFLTSVNFGMLDGKSVIESFLEKEISINFIKNAFCFVLKYIVEIVIIAVMLLQIIVILN